MIDRFAAFIVLGLVLVFGYNGIVGMRTGITRIPLAWIGFEEFDRENNSAHFWGVTVLNFSVATGLVLLLGYWWMNGMIE